MKRLYAATAALALSITPLAADEISDAIENALQAYQDGDNAYALEELKFAQQLLAALKRDELSQFLPEAPDGWTREISDDMAAGLAMIGGGSGAEAEYDNGSENFTITFIADSPMVMSMGAMIGNPALGGKPIRVGRAKFAEQDGDLMGLVANRVLVQASGADTETMLEVIKTIDMKGLGSFGQ